MAEFQPASGTMRTCLEPSPTANPSRPTARCRLPPSPSRGSREQPFAFYVHVPYCATRCGYCDFNTYTATELGGGASQAAYAQTAIEEVRLARKVLGAADLPVRTVFFGGGTPTMLPAADLVALLAAVRDEFGLAPGAEVTTEANPESVDAAYLAELRAGGFTRISFGMQSSRAARPEDPRPPPHARPPRGLRAPRRARPASSTSTSTSSTAPPARATRTGRRPWTPRSRPGPDHVSAYSLIVEEGTRLAARIKRGELPMPDEDVHADRYLMADEALAAAGYGWYEVSNWARTPRAAPGTTSCTGPAPTGGASGPARTATSAAPAGGTSSTPPPTRSAWPPASPRRTPARS